MRVYLLSLLIIWSLSGVAQTVPDKFRSIAIGTSEPDVIKLVGEPKSIANFVTVKNNSFDTSRYWRYKNDVIIVFTNHAVEAVITKWENLLKHIQKQATREDSDGLKIITNP
ncbi:MAG: hypothetical protein H3C45_10105 [Bacteroidia bacterium]|nr:hypothetical protein [Bacteroidia bacterium]MCZ2140994.1 hypothetical protein [Bacteroidia bacterium]